jgi:outer membrane protein TolC
VASGSAGRDFYEETGGSSDNFTGGLTMQVPLFRGFSQIYDIRQAEAQTDSSRARLVALEQQVTLQVWMSYYAFKTAEQQVKTSQDLLESAQQSQEVALGRYKAGVGGILDLLAAQSLLAGARAQNVQARTNWFLALAQLAYDTGSLWLGAEATAGPASANPGKKGKP